MPIATTEEQLALGASLRGWAKGAGPIGPLRQPGSGDPAPPRPAAAAVHEFLLRRHGDPADPETAELARWLDVQAKRDTVLTFGGGSNEMLRELIATAGLRLPRVPR